MAGELYGKLIREYIQLLSDNSTPTERLWELDRQIKDDRDSAGGRLKMTRFSLIENIIQIIHESVINITDIDEFNDTVCFVCERMGNIE